MVLLQTLRTLAHSTRAREQVPPQNASLTTPSLPPCYVKNSCPARSNPARVQGCSTPNTLTFGASRFWSANSSAATRQNMTTIQRRRPGEMGCSNAGGGRGGSSAAGGKERKRAGSV